MAIAAYPGKATPDRLYAVRGDTTSWPFALTQSEGGPAWDLSALTLTWAARVPGGDAVFAGSGGSGITVVSAVGGTGSIDIAPADWDAWEGAGLLEWDLQVNASGQIRTVAYGTIAVRTDVSA